MAKLTPEQRAERAQTKLRRLQIHNVRMVLWQEIERQRPLGEDTMDFHKAFIAYQQFDDLMSDLCRRAGVAQ